MRLSFVHSASFRFALALWAGSVLALYAAFFLQLDPAQWAGVTVWIMFVQTPRLNYAKLLYWALGTVGGAIFSVALVACFNQDRVLFLGGLTLWLAGCAFLANLAKSYNAYGAVLAGYTAAIVALSSVDQPEKVFDLAVDRVSAIFVGMAAAVLAMVTLLPRHPHWKETRKRLEELSHQVFERAVWALEPGRVHDPDDSSWTRIGDRLSLVEHTLEPTTAETADTRIRAGHARSLAASLFSLFAEAQAVEDYLAREEESGIPEEEKEWLRQGRELVGSLAAGFAPESSQALERLRAKLRAARREGEDVRPSFLLLCLENVLAHAESVQDAWRSLDDPLRPVRPSRLEFHRNHSIARMAALRMILAMTCVGIFWVATGWPAGNQFVLFTAVVCSLLTLQEDPAQMGWRFLQGALLCAGVAFFDLFWLLQKGEGFLILAGALGLFLVPAAYWYRSPAMIGSAVPSMLLFYNLVSPSNPMTYDIGLFLNNALGFLAATAFAFFSFHAIRPPRSGARCAGLLRAIWNDVGLRATGGLLSEQAWISLLCDRIRLLHRYAERGHRMAYEREARLALQAGLRHRRLRALLSASPDTRPVIGPVLRGMRHVSRRPDLVVRAIERGRSRLRGGSFSNGTAWQEAAIELSGLDAALRDRIPLNHA